MQIGVEEEVAAKDACRMEHVISEQTLECILKHMDKKIILSIPANV